MKLQKQLVIKIVSCLLIAIFLFNVSKGQTSENLRLLKQKIQIADSVILISHEVNEEFGVKEFPDWNKSDTTMNLKKWNEQHPPLQKFWINGKLNRSIIEESKTLNDSDRQTLIKILLRDVDVNKVTPSKCDEPRHSIIIYSKNKESYIDICFGCQQIHTSKDIDFSLFDMDEQKWNELKDFFKAKGITKVFKEYDE